MLELIKKLCENLQVDIPNKDKDEGYLIPVNEDVNIKITFFDYGTFLHSNIAPMPEKNREELFMYLMKANLLFQGTGGSVIGVDKEEKYLTLLYSIFYEVKYQEFKELVEDFVNFVIYWKKEVEKHNKLAEENIY